MKPSELFNLEPVHTDNDAWVLSKFLRPFILNSDSLDYDAMDKILFKYYAKEYFDTDYTWKLFSVWFEDIPVMICQSLGRDYDAGFFITNKESFNKLIEYVKKFDYDLEELFNNSTIGVDQDVEELTTFSGYSLDQFYDPNLKPKYGIGTRIKWFSNVGYYALKKEDLVTGEIVQVKPKNPRSTYRVKLDAGQINASGSPIHRVFDYISENQIFEVIQ